MPRSQHFIWYRPSMLGAPRPMGCASAGSPWHLEGGHTGCGLEAPGEAWLVFVSLSGKSWSREVFKEGSVSQEAGNKCRSELRNGAWGVCFGGWKPLEPIFPGGVTAAMC